MENMKNDKEVMLELRGIKKSFSGIEVLKRIDLSIHKGEVVAILGPSGSGKSTLLRCMNRLEEIDGGEIIVAGRTLVKEESGRPVYVGSKESKEILGMMGMVFQQFNLFPHMTVLENLIEAPIMVKKQSQAEAEAYALELLDKVGLSEKRDAYPGRLSGGQKQRVAIARAMAMKPEIMLFDEPTSALDPELTVEVLKTMKELAAEHMTMAVVTHEMDFARYVASHIVFMDGGYIIEEGSPKEFFENPREERTRQFLHKMCSEE